MYGIILLSDNARITEKKIELLESMYFEKQRSCYRNSIARRDYNDHSNVIHPHHLVTNLLGQDRQDFIDQCFTDEKFKIAVLNLPYNSGDYFNSNTMNKFIVNCDKIIKSLGYYVKKLFLCFNKTAYFFFSSNVTKFFDSLTFIHERTCENIFFFYTIRIKNKHNFDRGQK